MTRLRVTDCATDEPLGDLEAAQSAAWLPSPDQRAVVLPAVTPARVRGRTALEVVVAGWQFQLEVEDADLADLRDRATTARGAVLHDGPTEVRAIIPGRVISVDVTVGDVVTVGQRLLAVEAMKMENELRAPRDGTIERVATAIGQTVEPGALLVVIR